MLSCMSPAVFLAAQVSGVFVTNVYLKLTRLKFLILAEYHRLSDSIATVVILELQALVFQGTLCLFSNLVYQSLS
jgi:hypothetical protein